jgi:methylphosphotriester-DNA--protein-cysteine methyltransferase
MLSIETYTPIALSPYIKSFWRLEVPGGLLQPYMEVILPDGHHEIVFQLNAPMARKRCGSEDWHHDHAIYFSGQNRKSYTQRLDPGTILYGVRFYPHTQALFFDFPASLSTDNLISLPDVANADSLRDCIRESSAKTFENLEKEFTRRASRLKKPEDSFLYVDAAVRRIIGQQGNVKIELLEKITGVTARHLEKSFQKYVGISPKHFCNIVKYGSFVTYRKHHPEQTLTECAYEAEFHDQSHLIYLSRLITGQSPKGYFNKLNYINNFFLEP